MKFNDLVKITQTEKPYRNRPNQYPLYKRTHSHKYFMPSGDDKFILFCEGVEIGSMHKGDIFEWTHDKLYSSQINTLNQTVFMKDTGENCGYIYWSSAQLGFIWSHISHHDKGNVTKTKEYHIDKHMKLDMNKCEPSADSHYNLLLGKLDNRLAYKIREKYKGELIIAKQWIEMSEREKISEDFADMRKAIQSGVYKDDLDKFSPYDLALYVICNKNENSLIHDMTYNGWSKDFMVAVRKRLITKVMRHLRSFYYEKEKAYKVEKISWREGRIPRNQFLAVEFEESNPNKSELDMSLNYNSMYD